VVSHVWCMPPPQSSPFYRFYFQSSVVGTLSCLNPRRRPACWRLGATRTTTMHSNY
jgi:hypothetical protein